MNIERLKFANARGARIQFSYGDGWEVEDDPCWSRIQGEDGEVSYRAHPDDERLQYGLVSQGLIDCALYGLDWVNHPERDVGEAGFLYIVIQQDMTEDDRPAAKDHVEWSMYMLFAAEYLADLGL
jgi:hypothetical protein